MRAAKQQSAVKKELTETIDTRGLYCIHVVEKPLSHFVFDFRFFQVHTDETTQLFKMIVLERIWVQSNVHNKLNLFTIDF